MRFFIHILIVVVLGLSAFPCCVENAATADENITHVSADSVSDVCCDLCSPFYSCAACAGFVEINQIQALPAIAAEVLKLAPSTHILNFADSSDSVWQPPKNS